MAQIKKWDPERMKAATEATRNQEMGSCKAPRVFNMPQTTPERYTRIKDRGKAQIKHSKQNWVGSKFFLVKQKIIWLSAVC
jgi:hypothetical protein